MRYTNPRTHSLTHSLTHKVSRIAQITAITITNNKKKKTRRKRGDYLQGTLPVPWAGLFKRIISNYYNIDIFSNKT